MHELSMRSIGALIFLAGCMALVTAVTARADDGVGLVVAIRGKVTVQAPGERERPVSCGEVVRSGERLTTAAASRVAVLTGDVYAHLFVLSSARLSRGPEGDTTLFLERGRMRVIDPRGRGEGPPLWIATERAQTRFVGNDVDAYVLGPPGATNAMICSEGVELEVVRRDGASAPSAARFGECAIASLGKATYEAEIPSNRIALAEAYDCELPDSLAARFTPTDVAAAPSTRLPLPTAKGGLQRDSCDVPGSGCASPVSVPVDTVLPSPSIPLP